ncbi:MAG: hypothetical protein EBU90_18710 [Proteobacteria bacterium]|nr:hypothetical protein [Pseudomonadota bacterium]
MQFFNQIFKNFLNPFSYKGPVYSVGPNNFAELLKQFDQPPKQKTIADTIQDYKMKEAMAALEINMLKMDPTNYYQGSWRINNNDGTSDLDFVPCAVRPEVIYCSYGKN